MIGTLMEVKTRSDMDRIRGDGSDRSFWNVLMDSSSSSEFEAALGDQHLYDTADGSLAHYRRRKM